MDNIKRAINDFRNTGKRIKRLVIINDDGEILHSKDFKKVYVRKVNHQPIYAITVILEKTVLDNLYGKGIKDDEKNYQLFGIEKGINAHIEIKLDDGTTYLSVGEEFFPSGGIYHVELINKIKLNVTEKEENK